MIKIVGKKEMDFHKVEGVEKLNSDLLHTLMENYDWLWFDYSGHEHQLDELQFIFQFEENDIQICKEDVHRPKLESAKNYLFFVLHSLETDEVKEVNIFLTDKVVVSYCEVELEMIEHVQSTMKKTKRLLHNTYQLVSYIMAKLVNGYFYAVEQLEEMIEDLSDEEVEDIDIFNKKLLQSRQKILRLRKTIVPMRDLAYRLVNSTKVKNREANFRDSYGDLAYMVTIIEDLRVMCNDIRDSVFLEDEFKGNRNMRTLTVLTTIFMPLSFITGLYGMNFINMPELHYKYGYFVVLFVMVMVVVGLFVVFKKKKWF